MSLIRRNAVPLLVLMAVIAVGVGVFFSTTSFTFGQESTSCVPVAGGSLSATDEDGNPVTVVSNGDVVIYGATLGPYRKRYRAKLPVTSKVEPWRSHCPAASR